MILGIITISALTGCVAAPTATVEVTDMKLTSAAFEESAAIPARHTCDGEDVAPPLTWEGAPDGTAEFALIVEDPDARDFVHWVLTGIPGTASQLPDAQGDSIGTPGRNDFRRDGWGGPCPPSGTHRYVFTLYALSAPLDLREGATADAVLDAMSGASSPRRR